MEKVIAAIEKKYADKVWMVSQYIDECKDVVSSVKARWESGETFIYHGIFSASLFGGEEPKRDGDSEAEIEACADQLHGLLQGAIRKHWLRGLSREHTIAICNVLFQDVTDNYSRLDEPDMGYYRFGAKYLIIDGVEVNSPKELMRQWNDAHPDEQPIQLFYQK